MLIKNPPKEKKPLFNTFSVFWKRGDLGKYKDLEPVGIVDFNKQILGFTISDEVREIYLETQHPIIEKEIILQKIQENHYRENQDGKDEIKTINSSTPWRLNKSKLDVSLVESLYSGNKASTHKIDPIFMQIGDFEKMVDKTFDKDKDVKLDVRAFVGGNTTVGSGGTYSTWKLFSADLGTFTSNGVAQQVSSISEEEASLFDGDQGVYTLTCYGNKSLGYTVTCDVAASMFDVEMQGTGKVMFSDFDFRGNASASPEFIVVTGAGLMYPFIFEKSICDGNGVVNRGVRVFNTAITATLSNIIVRNTDREGIRIGLSDSSNLYEGITAYSCGLQGIYNSSGGDAGRFVNIASFDNGDNDYESIYTPSLESKIATSDSTGSEASLLNLDSGTVFASTVSTDDDFLVPVLGQALAGTGNDSYFYRSDYFNGVSITDVVDIGANGIERSTEGEYERLGIIATPTVKFSVDKVHGSPGTEFTFYNETTYQPESTYWDFGDGATSAFTTFTSTVTHQYGDVGTYDVILSAWDFCENTWTEKLWDYCRGRILYRDKPPISATELNYIKIAEPGNLSAMNVLIYTGTSGSNTKMSILEKVYRLTELHDPDLIDLEYIQYFANNLGYNVDVNRGQFGAGGTDAQTEEETNRYLRFMVQNLPSWYKIKTTKNAVKTMLFSFGLVGDMVYYYTKDYSDDGRNWAYGRIWFDITDNKLKEDLTKIPDDWYPTPHFAIWYDINKSNTNFSYDVSKQEQILKAINSIRPAPTVFKGVLGKWSAEKKLWVKPYILNKKTIKVGSDGDSDYWV